ncbi:MAG: hypothetical protein PHS31_03350 [Victivallaceae bacterium]|nr:hypothetical protein [Victivallaceae bacterium]MDD4180289.1 hypothetical protein [Victivallaceae bacterium]
MTKMKLKNQDAKEVFDDFERFEIFVHERWKLMLGIGIGVVLAVAAYGIILHVNKSANNKASSVLGLAKTEAELLKALEEYPSKLASVRTRLRLVKVYVDEKKYDQALAQLDVVKKADVSKEVRWRAELDASYIMELKGDFVAAAEEFDRIGTMAFVDEVTRSEANYAAGRLYLKSGNATKAESCLKRISSVGDGSNDFWKKQGRFLATQIPQQPATK